MNGLTLMLAAGLILLNFRHVSSQSKNEERKVEFNQKLADELKAMAEIDQIAAYIPQGKYKQWTTEKWDSFKDSVFTTHKYLNLMTQMHFEMNKEYLKSKGITKPLLYRTND
jgi:hypothetical protein